jgi:sucrose-6-phosphate hydrolase SacC (GH32 family)
MATGCGDKKKGGACLFKSSDFVNWTAVGWLHHPQGKQNTQFWECPDFFKVWPRKRAPALAAALPAFIADLYGARRGAARRVGG